MSQEFSKKEECNNIVKKWQIYFQVSDFKEKHFLNLNNNNNQSIHLTYSKDGAWLKHFGLSNSLCIYITRLITNHTPIDKYKLKFFPNKLYTCLYGNFSIKIRSHILYKYVQYIKSWNSKQESLKDILMFLKFNLGAFYFQEGII